VLLLDEHTALKNFSKFNLRSPICIEISKNTLWGYEEKFRNLPKIPKNTTK
jgi:hypothetical protein